MSKPTHRTDVLSLIFGLLFVGGAGWWAADRYLDLHLPWRLDLDWDLPHVGWFAAGALILVGLLGLVASLRRSSGKTADIPEDRTS